MRRGEKKKKKTHDQLMYCRDVTRVCKRSDCVSPELNSPTRKKEKTFCILNAARIHGRNALSSQEAVLASIDTQKGWKKEEDKVPRDEKTNQG